MPSLDKFNLDKQKIFIIVGVVCAILAIVIANSYLTQQRQVDRERSLKELAKQQANQVAVLIAKQDIPRGVEIDASMFDTKIFPNTYVQPQAVTSLDRIAGMTTIANISKNEQITLSKLVYNRDAASGLADSTPVGKRAVTIIVDNISTLAGLLQAGDHVDIVAMLPVPAQGADGKPGVQLISAPLFQDILVLAIGQNIRSSAKQAKSRYEKAEKAPASLMITVALSPEEANLIAFAQEQGRLRLILRSPADSKINQTHPATWDTLLQYIMPQPEPAPAPVPEPKVEKPEEPRPAGYIDVYRGLNKEKIPVYK